LAIGFIMAKNAMKTVSEYSQNVNMLLN